MYKRFRTDLAAEQRELTEGAGSLKGVRASSETRRGFEVTTVEILDREGEKALCKPVGRYITLDLEPLMSRDSECFEDAAELLAELLRGLLPPDNGSGTLVAGLGNDEMTPAAVGPLAVNSVIATRHLKRGMPEDFAAFTTVSAVKPGVLGATGIESAELLRSACRAASPSRLHGMEKHNRLISASSSRCRPSMGTIARLIPPPPRAAGWGSAKAAPTDASSAIPG